MIYDILWWFFVMICVFYIGWKLGLLMTPDIQSPLSSINDILTQHTKYHENYDNSTFTIMTYNVQNLPYMNGSPQCLQRLLCDQNADVICMQECFQSLFSVGSNLRRQMRKAGYYTASSYTNDLYQFSVLLDGGLLTCSRYPIVWSHYFRWKTSGIGADRFSSKGALFTLIQIQPHQYYLIINLHL
jgi:hypothetical protein